MLLITDALSVCHFGRNPVYTGFAGNILSLGVNGVRIVRIVLFLLWNSSKSAYIAAIRANAKLSGKAASRCKQMLCDTNLFITNNPHSS